MTNRFFSGSRPGSGKSGKGRAAQMFMKQMQEGNKRPQSSDDIYKKALEAKADGAGKAGFSFKLPGAKQVEKEPSKNVKAFMEQQAAKKASKENKKAREMVKISPKKFVAGGSVDSKGNIYGKDGKVIGKIDPNTGKIKNKVGNTVGKYVKDSTYSDFRIEQMIQKASMDRGVAGMYGTASAMETGKPAGTGATDWFWGKKDPNGS